MSVRVCETYGTSWPDQRHPGTRHWRSTSVSFGGAWLLGFGFWGLFILPFAVLWWMLLAELWLCAEFLLLAVTGLLAIGALIFREAKPADLTVTWFRWRLFAIGLKGARP